MFVVFSNLEPHWDLSFVINKMSVSVGEAIKINTNCCGMINSFENEYIYMSIYKCKQTLSKTGWN